MIKLMGCALIIISCTVMGFIKASSYTARRQELEATLELVNMVYVEMSYKKDSLYKIFLNISTTKDCCFADILRECSEKIRENRPFKESWLYAVEKHCSKSSFTAQDIAILSDISNGMGSSDAAGQEKIIVPVTVRLRNSIEDARLQEERQGRLWRSIGLGAGIIISVLII